MYQNKFHSWIIKAMLIFAGCVLFVFVFLQKDNPVTHSISENSISYYWLLFGFCSFNYAISMFLLYLGSMAEFKPGAKGPRNIKLWEILCFGLGILFGICSIPAALVFEVIYNLYIDRVRQSIYREECEKWSEIYRSRPCPFCGHSQSECEEDSFL